MKGETPLVLSVEKGIARLSIDVLSRKVNLLTSEVMLELTRVIGELGVDKGVRCLVVKSGKPGTFIAGADIKQIAAIKDSADAEAKSGSGQEVLNRLDDLPFPTIAVVDGAAMGGGLELALACDYRLATDNPRTKLGLPETGLGIIPGFGGTYRLPRTVGPAQALRMILSGSPIDGKRAAKVGLVDACYPTEFIDDRTDEFIARLLDGGDVAAEILRRRKRKPAALRLLEGNPIGRVILFRRARKDVLRRTGGHYPAHLTALRVIRTSLHSSRARALETERRAFGELAPTEISKNLVGLFFAQESAKRLPDTTGTGSMKKIRVGKGAEAARPARVRRAAVLGAGVMGGRIAWLFTKHDIPVVMKDIAWSAVQKGYAAAYAVYRELEKRHRLDGRGTNLKMHHLSGTLEYGSLMNPDAVIEAVVENLEVKKRVLAEVESAVGPETILASNTSSLSIEEMSGALKRPERFAGMHFFNPPNRMPLVEVIPGSKTSPGTVRALVNLAITLGKTPIVVKDCSGFLVNRLLLPYLTEAAVLAGEGVDYVRIDRLIEGFGMPMGPFALFDEIGIDVAVEVAEVLEAAYSDRMESAPIFDAFRERSDLLGKKSSKGFYLYKDGKKQKPNPEIPILLRSVGSNTGKARPPDDDVVGRPIFALLNEAARSLDDGVVATARELDLALIFGIGFPPFRGGILRYADHLGLASVESTLERYAAARGKRFDPAPLIGRLAASGRKISAYGAATESREGEVRKS